MSSLLARRFRVDVSTDNATWVAFKGIKDLAIKEVGTEEDVTDYDTGGFASREKILSAAELTIKARRPSNSGVLDPGQELVRAAGQFQFGTAARIYVRWYDRNGLPEAFTMYALVEYNGTGTAVAKTDEITVVLKSDGTVTSISNPFSSPAVPTILSFSPASGATTGTMLQINGTGFTGVTAAQVKSAAVAMTSITVVSDNVIVAILPSQTAGTYAFTVTNGAGTSTGVNYTRGA